MKQVQKPRKPLIVYYLIAIAVLILFNSFVFPAIVGGNVEEVYYGTFLTMVENKEVSKVQLEGESIYFTDKSEDSRQYETTRFDDPDLVNRLEKAGCKFGRVADRQMSPFLSMLLSIVIPMIIFILLGQFLSRQLMKKMGGAAGGNQFMQFGKSNAKVYVASTTGIKFDDVAGEDEAKELLTEIVDFLQWRQEGWVMLCPTLAALWRKKTGEAGLPLAVMELPEGVGFSLPEAEYRTHTATAAAGCNRAVGEVSPAQYEAAVVNLHLAERRRVGHTVTLERDGKAVSAAAVTDCGTRYGQISYVATLPEYEGQGYGRAVVYHCAGWLLEKNLIPLVACEAHRESFYAGLGFQKISEVTIFTG